MESTGSQAEALERLRLAVERGTDHDLNAWAATGLYGLRLLRDVLNGKRKLEEKSVYSRDASDNMTAAVAAIAKAHPADFLDVFADPAFDKNSFVLVGLGQIDDPRATDRLAGAAKSRDYMIRMDAAIGLGRRRSQPAVVALAGLLGDCEYLVRYHALKGLAKVGDETALTALIEFAAPTEYEKQLAKQAVSAIEARTG
jgi:HEAT repeat protein